MLVLTRRIGEEIIIAGNIHVSVLSIKGKNIRLGVTAPPTVPVIRMELLARAPQRRQLVVGENGARGEARL